MSCSSCNTPSLCFNTSAQNTTQCTNIPPTLSRINKYNQVDCSGNDASIEYSPPICGTCPLKLNSIPRSPYRSIETPMSVYTANISSLYVYQKPSILYPDVNWNQSSDRAIPHTQPTNVQRNSSSLRATRTGSKPGSMAPGGVGVDIKHNSFNRYNLRLRGAILKKPQPSSTILKFPSYRFKSSTCYVNPDCYNEEYHI